jgi:Flp pilus assembly protein TadB
MTLLGAYRSPQPQSAADRKPRRFFVITLGVILLVIGFVAKISILWTVGIVLVVAGLVLMLLGSLGRAVGGRRHYY